MILRIDLIADWDTKERVQKLHHAKISVQTPTQKRESTRSFTKISVQTPRLLKTLRGRIKFVSILLNN